MWWLWGRGPLFEIRRGNLTFYQTLKLSANNYHQITKLSTHFLSINYHNFKIINSFCINKLSKLQNYQLTFYQQIIKTLKLSAHFLSINYHNFKNYQQNYHQNYHRSRHPQQFSSLIDLARFVNFIPVCLDFHETQYPRR